MAAPGLSAREAGSTKAVAVALVSLLLGIRFFYLINKYAVNVPFWDQWDFLRLFFDPQPRLREMFLLQHGPPRLGLGLVLDYFLYLASRWNVRAESFVIGACIFVAMILAFALKRRLFGAFQIADVLIVLLFLTKAQYETLIGTPNLGYSGLPLLLLMAYCLALTISHAVLKWTLVLILDFLLIYTGFGFFAGPVTIVITLIELYRSWKGLSAFSITGASTALLASIAIFGSFFLSYTFVPAVDCFGFDPHIHRYLEFMAYMTGSLYGHITPWAGIVSGTITLLFGLGALATSGRWLLSRHGNVDAPIVVFALVTFSLIYSANTALGRLCLGIPAAAQMSRYVTLMVPLIFGIYLWLASLRPRFSMGAGWKHAAAGASILVLIVFLLSTERAVPVSRYAEFTNWKVRWVDCYKRTKDIAGCDQAPGRPIYPLPERTHLQEKLDYLEQHHLSLFASEKDSRAASY